MAKQRETRFKEKFQAFLKTLPNTWYVKTQQRSVRGIPDNLICVRGQFIAAELKTDDGLLDPLQEWTLSGVRAAGGLSLEVRPANFDAVAKLLIELATGKRVLMQEPADDERKLDSDH